MTPLRLLCVLAAMGAAHATSVRVHVRVHTAARAASPPRSSLVCPLGDGFDAPRVVLPCPYDCSGQGNTTARACVLYPASTQAFCAGDCVRGDSCAVQCLPPTATEKTWVVCAATNTSTTTEKNCSLTVDATVVRGLKIMDGYAPPSQLKRVSIHGEQGSPFQIPASLFDRMGPQATAISLGNVVLEKDTTSATLGTLSELRVVNSGLEQCPLEPAQLPQLSILDLTNNRINQFNGTGFQRLRELYLGENEIQDLPAASLPAQLQVLDVSSNALSQLPGDVSTALVDLCKLTLDHNALRSLPKNAFPKASTITTLSLRNTSLATVPLSVFQLKKLSILNLDDNDLSKGTALNLSRIAKSLTQLSVNGAGLCSLPTGLENLHNFSSLSLASNNFSTNAAIDCSQLPRSLVSLNLSMNHQLRIPRGLEALPLLAQLDLSGNEFDGQVDASLLSSSLTSLYLDNCQLKARPTHIERLQRLQTLSLKNNPLVGEFPVGGLSVMTTLLLDGTKITRVASFPASPSSLERFSCLNCTELTFLPPLPVSINTLSLSHIPMKSIPKGTIPTTLRFLSITNASSLSTVPDDVSLLTDVSELIMSRCNLTDFPSHAGFQRLEKLELAQNRLQSFSIANATKLTQLNLSHNSLDKIPPTIFHLAALERLHLEGNPIRGFQPSQSELTFLMKIPFLSMDQEQFSSNCKSPTRIKQFTVCPSRAGGDEPAKSLGDDTANIAITKTETERSSSGWIIALDVLLAIGIVVALALIVRRDKRERRQRFNAERQNIYDTLAAQRSPRMTTLDVNELAAFRLEMDALVKSRRIATGSASEVWLAIHAAKRVAVKQLIPDEATPEAVQRFTHEGKLLSELSHRHIVAFVGVAWTDTTDLALVTIFAGKGDLRTYLKTAPRPADGDWDVGKLKMALGMAEALVYLHSLYQPVRHQNLQSRNVLLDDQCKTMVAGFDCAVRARSVASKAVDDGSLASRVGSVRWLAPEILSGSPYDASVDIFSLGVVLSELDTHALPYAAVQDETGQPMGDEEIKSRVADGTLRLALSPTCPRLVRELALRCSSFEPSDRPRAEEVVNALREIHHARLKEQAATGTSV